MHVLKFSTSVKELSGKITCDFTKCIIQLGKYITIILQNHVYF